MMQQDGVRSWVPKPDANLLMLDMQVSCVQFLHQVEGISICLCVM